MRQDGSTKTRGSTRTRKERRTRRNEQIEFCQRCDTRLILMLGAAGSCVLACSKCGYEKAAKNFSLRFPEQTADDSIIIIGQKEAQLHVQPFIKIHCPKCDGKRAYYWTTTIGEEEEPIEVYIFRCTKCRHTWREK